MPRTSRTRVAEASESLTGMLRFAEALCRDKGLSFTPIRRDVYELICRAQAPVGAYDLLDQLKPRRASAAPVTVYRALDFLMDAGLVHRVEALNAFTACHTHEPGHGGLLLICRQCSNVIELRNERLERNITRTAADVSFEASRDLVEVSGLCRSCRS